MLRFTHAYFGTYCLALFLAATTHARADDAQAPSTPAVPGDVQLELLPKSIVLEGKEGSQQVVLQRSIDGAYIGQQREAVVLTSDNPSVAKIEESHVIATGNGTAMIEATLDGKVVARSSVTVTKFDAPFEWSFRNHVESVLSKQGCNGGACHGARAGQKGFRLTLFGFDVDADYSYLTRQALGRRVVPTDPGRSLILTKPTGLLPHKGGVRLDVASKEYRVLAEWIASGTPGPSDADPQITRLEVLPEQSVQKLGDHQQIVVLAHFSDGHVEDATRWSKYTSVHSTVATVGEHGDVEIVGPGEGAIKIWYLNYSAMAFVTVPYASSDPAKANVTTEKLAARNFIDERINAKLAALQLPASPRASDATFLRRAYLDTIGVLPTAAETRAFLEDVSPDKRDRVIDALLARPEFVDYWSYKWSDLLLLSGDRLRPKAIETYYGWIRKSVEENKPWDVMVREIVTATGSTHENGAANFYALHQDPEMMAETVAQAFMGLSINCAKCHNHPLEKWTNDQYYGLANMFSRVRAKGWGGDFRGGDGMRVVYSDTQGELVQPSRGIPQAPRPLDGAALEFADPIDRRVPLASWLTSPENPYFTRAIANRIWANFFGVGLVEKVDDMRATNPSSNEPLLDDAAKFLVEKKYNLRELMRAILQSESYQRDSQSLPGNKPDERFYSRYYPKRLKAEVMLDAVSQVTAVPTKFKDKPAGTRALQLPDVAVESYFLSTFGRPQRLITCDCERSDEPSMPQVLHLYNGDVINQRLKDEASVVKSLVEKPTPEIIDELYLSSLSRFPTAEEKARLATEIDAAPAEERRAVIEDLYWSVLSSREFLFNH